MIKNYILYKENNGDFVQFVRCDELEIEMYPYVHIEYKEDFFEFDSSYTYKVVNGLIENIERTDMTYLLSQINTDYSANAKSVINGIPSDEVLTFPIQKEEAKAWFKDNNEPTPFIDGMLTKRTDVTKAQLVDKILEKANSYAYLAGTLTGERQKQEKLILNGA